MSQKDKKNTVATLQDIMAATTALAKKLESVALEVCELWAELARLELLNRDQSNNTDRLLPEEDDESITPIN